MKKGLFFVLMLLVNLKFNFMIRVCNQSSIVPDMLKVLRLLVVSAIHGLYPNINHRPSYIYLHLPVYPAPCSVSHRQIRYTPIISEVCRKFNSNDFSPSSSKRIAYFPQNTKQWIISTANEDED